MIDETIGLLTEMEVALTTGDGKLSPELRKTIKHYNQRILGYSSDKIIPAKRPFGGRWFDDFSVSEKMIEQCKGD